MSATLLNQEHHERFDRLQLAALVGLMIIGTLFVYSATMANPVMASLPWYDQAWLRQLVWYALGFGAGAALCVLDYHTLARWSFVAYWVTIFFLIIVLVPHIGSMKFGARRWIDLGPFQFQPSEFAKLAFILALAHFLSRPADELRLPGNFWKGIGLLMLPFALTLKEPDLGSALVMLPTGLVMMFVAGTPKSYLLKLIGAVGLLAALFLVDVLFVPPGWWQISMEPYQRDRLLVYFGRDYRAFASANATPAELQRRRQQQLDDEYNVRQALISVGSGGLTGKGWRQGTQNALGYLPRAVAHNDFIFSVIAEQEGFVGSMLVLALYALVLFTGLRIAGQARDRLGRLVAVGVVTLIFSHVFINIGMNIRIMPVTGVPLPLLSYGGSSVLGSLIAVGLMQNVHIHRKGY
ncbi:MAG TPA: FtsW/RodA/SpoVE family cell cycle protein [Candidatus Limnocylindrales bacterium]|nr:FtsW/RodA/SpoVE family cell cycle protein [Candidatus Limnocylindrales bacterium]